MPDHLLRRSLVAGAAVVSLVGAVAVVRAAGDWTAANATLTAKPADAATLASQLQDEQARSADLQAKLVEVESQAKQLADALQTAQDRAQADEGTASSLAQQLAAAKAKLESLQAALAASQTTTTQAGPAAPATPGGGDDGPGDD